VIYEFCGFSFKLDGPPDDPAVQRVYRNFESLQSPAETAELDLEITSDGNCYSLTADSQDVASGFPAEELIYEVEGCVVVQAQLSKPSLVFVHAAALTINGSGLILVGESGAGKSTLCWALTHHGFRYLSDELVPLSVGSGEFRMHAYPHALCLKQAPAAPYLLPPEAFSSGRTWHIPVNALMSGENQPMTHVMPLVEKVLFVNRQSDTVCSTQLTVAEVVHGLYAQILNPLAHPNKGLTVASDIARSVSGYSVNSQDLEQACCQIGDLMSAR